MDIRTVQILYNPRHTSKAEFPPPHMGSGHFCPLANTRRKPEREAHRFPFPSSEASCRRSPLSVPLHPASPRHLVGENPNPAQLADWIISAPGNHSFRRLATACPSP